MAYCDRCDRYFAHDRALYQHETNSPNHHICSTCGKDFPTSTGLIQHYVQSRLHFYCQRCDKHFNSANALLNHNNAVHYFCAQHGQYFKSAEGLLQHYKQSSEHHYCSFCNMLFNDVAELIEHGKDEHYICISCVTLFPTFDELANHNECSHNYCRDCDRLFNSPANLAHHRASSIHTARSITCPGRGCGKSFVSVSALLLHAESGSCPAGITRAAVNDFVAGIDKQNVITNPARMIAGPGGTRLMPREPEYWASERSWNGLAYECFLCHSLFSTLRALNAHLQSPRHREKIYRCPKSGCGVQYSALSALCQHVESGACGVGQIKQVRDIMGSLTSGMRAIAL